MVDGGPILKLAPIDKPEGQIVKISGLALKGLCGGALCNISEGRV